MSTEITVEKFINEFKKIYDNDKVLLFDIIESDMFSLSEKEEIFKRLSDKNKAKLYNLMTSESRKTFYEYFEKNDASNAKKFQERLRSYGVNNGLLNELDLLDNGYCTRDWSIEQIRDIVFLLQDSKIRS